MEKYEFNIKAEQMQKMAAAGDYKTAMQIADGIDWRRVRNANMLAMVSEIYERNGEFEEARDILLMAFDRAPVGKRFLYKLAEISVEAGNLEDAQDFYREFCEINPEDSRAYLLRYKILRAKGAKPEQLAGLIEDYTALELDEKWLYELALLYEASGKIADCVRTCDKISLLFGKGQYVTEALELKQHYHPLSVEQQILLDSRKGPVETSVPKDYYLDEGPEEEREEQSLEMGERFASSEEAEPEQAFRTETPEEIPSSEAAEEAEAQNSMESFVTAQTAEKKPEVIEQSHSYHMIIEAETLEAGFQIAVNEIKYFHEQYGLEYKVAKISAEKLNQRGFASFTEKLEGKDLIIEGAGSLLYPVVDEISAYLKQKEGLNSLVLVDAVDHFDQLAADKPDFIQCFELVSALPEKKEEEEDLLEEVDLSEAPMEAAKEEELASREITEAPAAKSEGSELNAVVEDTESEQEKLAAELRASMERPSRPLEETERIQPERVEGIAADFPEKKDMSLEEFAAYAQDYAKSIDCVIPERALRSMYEKIEILQEDGVPLSRKNAEDMVEDAADKAEKPKLFRPKYDKNDKLILHEDCFL